MHGKTGLKSFLINESQSLGSFSKFIEFNPDEISTHHKFYPEIIQNYPDDSYTILQRFTRRALDEYLRQRAVEIRCNIMQEGTFGSTDSYIEILNFQKNGGNVPIGRVQEDGKRTIRHVRGNYIIEVNTLAVNRYESLLSCFEREQDFDESGLPPRAVTIENHDRAYEKMLDTIDIIEKRKLYDKMRVFRRGYIEERPELIYITGDRRFQSTAEAIRQERKKQTVELFKNPEPYIIRIKDLKARATNYQNTSLIRRIDTLENMFYKQLEECNKSKEIDE